MPSYKDEKRNTWYCLFYYEDWQGNKKKKQKRGFKTKKEAQEWKNSFKLSANANMDMALGAFVEIYFQDKAGELKERSIKSKRYMIKAHIIPYFENKPMNAISPSDIIKWQNIIKEKGYAQTYLRMCSWHSRDADYGGQEDTDFTTSKQISPTEWETSRIVFAVGKACNQYTGNAYSQDTGYSLHQGKGSSRCWYKCLQRNGMNICVE